MSQKNKARLTEGSVLGSLIKITVPMIWGVLSIMSYNLVDTIFIGRLGTVELAAVSFTFPVVMVIMNLAIGLGIGASSVIARAIGEHDRVKIENLAISSLLLASLVIVVFVVAGFLTIKPLFSAIGADSQTLPLIEEYMTVWYSGVTFLVIPMVGNFIIRSTGDMFWPGIIMVASSVINIILDPLLIFGMWGFPALGIKGAAIATVISWVVTFCASMSILFFREKLIHLYRIQLRTVLASWKVILHVAIPAAATHMIIPIGAGIIMSMIAGYGQEAVAAFGAASRIETFAFVIFLAQSSIIGPFVGQNMGAKRYDRISEALNMLYKFCIYFGLLSAVVLAVFSRPLMSLFTDNLQVIHYGEIYFYIMPLAYMTHGIIFIASGVFNGSGHPVPAAVISAVRMFVLYIPLAFILQKFFGLYGVFASYTVSCLIMGFYASYLSRAHIQNISKQLA